MKLKVGKSYITAQIMAAGARNFGRTQNLPAVRRELLLPITMTSPEPSRAVFWGLRKSMLLLAIGTEWDRETFDGVKPFWTLRGSDCATQIWVGLLQ